MKILESRELSKGIFWIKDINNIADSAIYFDIPCDSEGVPETTSDLNAKSGITYNHEKTWSGLGKRITDGERFDYYPRGRVEINRGVATIYANPNIPQEELREWAIQVFNLTTQNGINSIRVIADGSDHYKCYLDEEVCK